MLVNSTVTHLKLEKIVPKILKLCPTANHNFLMIVTTDQFDEEKLIHVDSRGRTLWERSYK